MVMIFFPSLEMPEIENCVTWRQVFYKIANQSFKGACNFLKFLQNVTVPSGRLAHVLFHWKLTINGESLLSISAW